MKIENSNINESSSVFIIAELSANHGNDINIVRETIKAAKRTGADAIKIQTYTADTITIDSKNWVMIRPSGTEPIIRIYAESESKENLEALMFKFLQKVKYIISR